MNDCYQSVYTMCMLARADDMSYLKRVHTHEATSRVVLPSRVVGRSVKLHHHHFALSLSAHFEAQLDSAMSRY